MNEALAELVAAEERGRLWGRRVLGYPIWPLMRLERYRRALLRGETVIRPGAAGEPAGPRTRLAPVGRLVRETRRLLSQGLPPRDGRDIWVISSSTYRRRISDGSYPCIFAEHVREQLGGRLRFMEVNASGLPIAEQPDVFLLDGYMQQINAWASVLGPRLTGLVPSEDAEAFAPTPPQALARHALYGHLLERVAAGFLRASRPRAVFALCAYASMIPLLRAVRRAGIPVIELQHGVIHDSHPGYVFQAGVPERDYRPDHILLFGSHFGSILAQHSPELRSSWSVAGHPWLRRVRAAALKGGSEGGPAARSIVVFGQYDPPVQAQLKTFVPELRAVLPPSVKVIYKPHPREPVADLEAALGLPGISIASPSEDAYSLLATCRVSITVYSTLAIEALAFRCSSVVIRSPHWNEDVRTLVQQGSLHAVENAREVLDILDAPVAHGDHWSNRMFGIDEPEPDFVRLIERVAADAGRS